MQKWEELAYARDEGHAEGVSEGENLSIIKMVCKKLQKGKTPEEISEDLEADLNEMLRIYNAAKEYSPDYDAEKIYERLYK